MSKFTAEFTLEVRDSLVSFLASSTGLGEAIAYYATSPVSLSLAIRMQRFLDDEIVVRAVSNPLEGDESGTKKYGPWLAATSKKRESSGDLVTKVKEYLVDLVLTSESLDLDMRGIHARGWTQGGDEAVPLRTAGWAAFFASFRAAAGPRR